MVCDICKDDCGTIYYDGATKMGPWANMCRTCFKVFGIGLGTGRGQEYHKDENDKWIKKAG